ncbi:hypothetical protein MMPV_000455 [Pyropia vietnamensis]
MNDLAAGGGLFELDTSRRLAAADAPFVAASLNAFVPVPLPPAAVQALPELRLASACSAAAAWLAPLSPLTPMVMTQSAAEAAETLTAGEVLSPPPPPLSPPPPPLHPRSVDADTAVGVCLAFCLPPPPPPPPPSQSGDCSTGDGAGDGHGGSCGDVGGEEGGEGVTDVPLVPVGAPSEGVALYVASALLCPVALVAADDGRGGSGGGDDDDGGAGAVSAPSPTVLLGAAYIAPTVDALGPLTRDRGGGMFRSPVGRFAVDTVTGEALMLTPGGVPGTVQVDWFGPGGDDGGGHPQWRGSAYRRPYRPGGVPTLLTRKTTLLHRAVNARSGTGRGSDGGDGYGSYCGGCGGVDDGAQANCGTGVPAWRSALLSAAAGVLSGEIVDSADGGDGCPSPTSSMAATVATAAVRSVQAPLWGGTPLPALLELRQAPVGVTDALRAAVLGNCPVNVPRLVMPDRRYESGGGAAVAAATTRTATVEGGMPRLAPAPSRTVGATVSTTLLAPVMTGVARGRQRRRRRRRVPSLDALGEGTPAAERVLRNRAAAAAANERRRAARLAAMSPAAE